MDKDSLQSHLDKRFDRLEHKLDDHLSRISKAETEIHWIKGISRISLTLLLAVIGFLIQLFWPKHS